MLSLLAHPPVPTVPAARAADFLDSIGANSAISLRGERLEKTIECARYVGLRWFRSGIEGGPSLADLVRLRRETGARLSWSPGSGGADLDRLLSTARELAKADALLAFEGPNEPNNWGVEYGGQKGGRGDSWVAVAKLQRDLFARAKADPILRKYPVWGISECGAETDDVGLQFLTVPQGAGGAMPEGTRYADAANVHNYVYHPNSPAVEDNKTWNAADPTPACRVDGLYGEVGLTWARHYRGYSPTALLKLPRVTTETGCAIEGAITEEVQALNVLSLYLDQFKRGWSHTALYLLRDRVDEAGNQRFGLFGPDYAPRKAAVYLHNLTTILSDPGRLARPGRLAYAIPDEPPTVHDLLLQKADGSFALVVWSERVSGTNRVEVRLAAPTKATLYDPTVGASATRTLEKTVSIPLSLTDHPVVIGLRASR